MAPEAALVAARVLQCANDSTILASTPRYAIRNARAKSKANHHEIFNEYSILYVR